MIFTTNHFKNHLIFTLICLPLKTFTFYFTDEYNNNENGLISNHDILKFLNKSGIDETSSQISRTLPRQDTHTSDTSVDINIFNDEMRLRNNIENMYKKGKFHNIYQELYYIENEKGVLFTVMRTMLIPVCIQGRFSRNYRMSYSVLLSESKETIALSKNMLQRWQSTIVPR